MHTASLFCAITRVAILSAFCLAGSLAMPAASSAHASSIDVYVRVGSGYQRCRPADYPRYIHGHGRTVLKVYRQDVCGTMWLYEEVPYVNGQRHGQLKRYARNHGHCYLDRKVPFYCGKREGTVSVFDPHGRVIQEISFANNARNGWDISYGYTQSNAHHYDRFEVSKTYYQSGSVCATPSPVTVYSPPVRSQHVRVHEPVYRQPVLQSVVVRQPTVCPPRTTVIYQRSSSNHYSNTRYYSNSRHGSWHDSSRMMYGSRGCPTVIQPRQRNHDRRRIAISASY